MSNEALLSAKPFKPSSWATKIDFINHLTLFNSLLIAVFGEQEGGKTSFIQLLQLSLDSSIRFHAIQAVAPFDEETFLQQLSNAFHLRRDLDVSMSSLVTQVNERKAPVLLTIDDAHHLNNEFLEALLAEIRQRGQDNFFHICLVGDYTLASSLREAERNAESTLVHPVELSALSLEETKQYLLQRLHQPRRLDRTMTDKQLTQFYDITEGHIALINRHMVEFFEVPAQPIVKKSPFNKVNKALAAVTALAIGGYLGQTVFLKQQRVQSGANLQYVSRLPLVSMPDVIEPLGSITISYLPQWTLGASFQLAQLGPKRELPEFEGLFDDDEELSNNFPPNQFAEIDRVLITPKVIKTEPKQEVNAAIVASKAKTPSEVTHVVAENEAGKLYTLQLLSGRNRDNLERMIRSNPLLQEASIRKVQRDGRDWFILTYGQYHQPAESREAMQKLAQFKPWVRSMTGLG